MNGARGIALSGLAIAAALARPAVAKETLPDTAFKLTELESEVKTLTKGKDAPAQFHAFMQYLGLPDTCTAAHCKKIASHWTKANLDEDKDDEKVLSITTMGEGACAPIDLTVIVFDSTPKGWKIAARKSFHHAGAAKAVADVSAENVHSAQSKDLVVHLDGQCKGAARDQELQVFTLQNGRLLEVVSSKDFVGTGLVSYKLGTSAPVSIELTDGKGKTKLLYDEESLGYDTLAPFADAMKTIVTKSDDELLSSSECAAPITGAMAGDCKLKGDAKAQVLVQNGKAIGLTVTATPAKPSFVRCMRKAIATTTWKSVAGATGCTRTFSVK